MIYLHIGRHKTGTSRLQEFLTLNSNKLEDLGITYPVLGKKEIAHHDIALYLTDPTSENNPDSLGSKGARDIASVHKVFDRNNNIKIISSEGLQNIHPRRAREIVEKRNTTVVCYLREQASYAISSYSQLVIGTQYAGSFSDYMKTFFAAVNYPVGMRHWANEFGLDRLRLRVYDRDLFDNNDICRDFLSVLGIVEVPSKLNFTTSIITNNVYGDLLKLKIALNKFGFDEAKYRVPIIVGSLRALAKDYPHFSAKPNITAKFAEEIRCHYKSQNAQLFDDFQIENAKMFVNSTLYGDDSEPYLDRGFDWRSISKVEEILTKLYDRKPFVGRLFERALEAAEVKIN